MENGKNGSSSSSFCSRTERRGGMKTNSWENVSPLVQSRAEDGAVFHGINLDGINIFPNHFPCVMLSRATGAAAFETISESVDERG